MKRILAACIIFVLVWLWLIVGLIKDAVISIDNHGGIKGVAARIWEGKNYAN